MMLSILATEKCVSNIRLGAIHEYLKVGPVRTFPAGAVGIEHDLPIGPDDLGLVLHGFDEDGVEIALIDGEARAILGWREPGCHEGRR